MSHRVPGALATAMLLGAAVVPSSSSSPTSLTVPMKFMPHVTVDVEFPPTVTVKELRARALDGLALESSRSKIVEVSLGSHVLLDEDVVADFILPGDELGVVWGWSYRVAPALCGRSRALADASAPPLNVDVHQGAAAGGLVAAVQSLVALGGTGWTACSGLTSSPPPTVTDIQARFVSSMHPSLSLMSHADEPLTTLLPENASAFELRAIHGKDNREQNRAVVRERRRQATLQRSKMKDKRRRKKRQKAKNNINT